MNILEEALTILADGELRLFHQQAANRYFKAKPTGGTSRRLLRIYGKLDAGGIPRKGTTDRHLIVRNGMTYHPTKGWRDT